MGFNYNEEKLREAIKESKSLNEVLRKFGRNNSGAAFKGLKKLIEQWNIDVSHFSMFSRKSPLIKAKYDEVFCIESKISRGSLKKRILSDNLIPYICISCGQDENWLGKKITLILDHINGISNDNRIENLRILCPNCNATLETHCKGYAGVLKANEKIEKKRNKIDKRTLKKGTINIDCRKVKNRPSIDDLLEDIKIFGYRATGRKYDVSDNTIKKWLGENAPKIRMKPRRMCGKPKCSDCNIEISYDSIRCKKCKSLNDRKVGRPTIEILQKEFNEHGLRWCVEKYGVVRQTIGKWLKELSVV